jgi:ectoine hydroxylase
MGWHIDGHDDGYRSLGWPIPLLQLKIGYYLTDMTEPGRGNLCVIPGSHRALFDPDPEDRKRTELFPGAIQVCAPAGSAIMFHNALLHSSGPWTQTEGMRIMLYYAYEHPWMMASAEHWNYPRAFYNSLSPERRKLFHGCVFDPPEQRWG